MSIETNRNQNSLNLILNIPTAFPDPNEWYQIMPTSPKTTKQIEEFCVIWQWPLDESFHIKKHSKNEDKSTKNSLIVWVSILTLLNYIYYIFRGIHYKNRILKLQKSSKKISNQLSVKN